MTKEELEIKISTLQNLVTQKNEELSQYANQIDTLKGQLEDINKPKLTSIQFDKLLDAIEKGVGQFDFDDDGNYDYDFGIDYDNRITLESFCFNNTDELAREIYDYVSELFAEIKEDDNQENQD